MILKVPEVICISLSEQLTRTLQCFFVGGQEENVGDRSDILKFDPSTEAWTRSGEMRVKRSDHTISEVKWRDYSEYCI